MSKLRVPYLDECCSLKRAAKRNTEDHLTGCRTNLSLRKSLRSTELRQDQFVLSEHEVIDAAQRDSAAQTVGSDHPIKGITRPRQFNRLLNQRHEWEIVEFKAGI